MTAQSVPSRLSTTPEGLRDAVATLLGQPPDSIDVDDDLLRLGLDSIAVIRLANGWRRAGIDITASELFECRTVREWSQLCSRDAIARNDKIADPNGVAAHVGSTALAASEPTIPKVDERAPFELATMQLAYWVGRQDGQVLGGVGAHFYNEFDGQGVDGQRLEHALHRLIERHGMLRAVFLPDGRQLVTARGAWTHLTVHDLRRLPMAKVDDALTHLRATLTNRRLDVDSGQVFDVHLSLLPHGRTRVHLQVEMLVADAQSFRVIMSDLAAFYLDTAHNPDPLGIAFAQYLATRAAYRDARREGARQYWRERLDALPATPQLPLATEPRRLGAPRTTRLWHYLSTQQWDRAAARASEHGVTLSVLFLTAFAEVLSTWSGGRGVLVNLPLYDREALHPDVDRLVGDFTRTVLLHVDFEASAPFAVRASAVGQRLHESIDQSSYSGVEVLRDLARARPDAAASAPLVFTSTLGLGELFDRQVRSAFGDPGWSSSQTPQVWLDHQVTEREGTLLLNWDVIDGLFPPGLVEDMFATYLSRLDDLIDDRGWGTAATTLPATQARTRAAANDTDTPMRRRGLHDDVFARAAETPEATALLWGRDGRLRYGELTADALQVAAALRAQGVGPGDLVVVSLPKGPDQIRAVLGVFAAGCCYLPIGIEQPPLRRARIVQQASPAAILAVGADGWPDSTPVISWSRVRASPAAAAAVPGEPDGLAYVLFTSGSTGEPKGVEVSHSAALNTIDDLVERLEIGTGDVTLALSELDFDLSVFDVFAALGTGGAVALLQEEDRRTPDAWARLAARHRVSVINCVPALLDQLLTEVERGAEAPVALRAVLLGGDWVGLDLPARLASVTDHCRFLALGGTTETAIHSTVCEVDVVPAEWRSIPYGVGLRNVRCRVVDPFGRDCPDWVPGELWIGGAGVARGYRGDPARTADRFVLHDGLRWYRTGDMAHYLPDGQLAFVGRADRQVKLRGYRLELGEIEAAIRSHPAVSAAAVSVVGAPACVGAVICPQGRPIGTAELRRSLADRLPPYMLPAVVHTTERLPLTPNGKVDHAAVTALLEAEIDQCDDRIEACRDLPCGDREQRVAALWCELLGRRDVHRTDDFFALGGDSLVATRLVGRLREAGYCNARLVELYTTPVLADFSAALRRDAEAAAMNMPTGGARLVADGDHCDEPFPATTVQRAYLLGRRSDLELGGVGSHWYCEFDGPDVDLPRLQACWNTLVRRHEMLRALFDEQGRQRILSSVPPQSIGVDVAAAGRENEGLAKLRAELSQRLPDPYLWPLVAIRALVYSGRTRIAFSFDYLVLDALSIVTILSELSQLYADDAAQLPPIEVSFRDYVVSVRPPPAELEAARSYWREQIPSLSAGPQLPLRVDPSSLAAPRFTRRQGHLDPGTWQVITARCRCHGVTPAAVLATAYFDVLAAWSNCAEFSVVHTVFDRREVHQDIGRVVGDFTSLMLIDRHKPAGGNWLDRVRAVQSRTWAAMEHRAVTAIDVMRDMGRISGTGSVMVPVVFTSALGLPKDLTQFTTSFGEHVWGVSQTPQIWLDNQVMERAGGLSFNWDAVEELFPDGVLDSMFGAYSERLQQLAHCEWTESFRCELPRLQRAVRDRVNATAGPLPDHVLHEPFFVGAERQPDADALCWGDGERLSYSALAERALRVASRLVAVGVEPGEVVAVHLERGADQIAAVLGVLAAGAAYLPLGMDQPAVRRARILRDARARVVLVGAKSVALQRREKSAEGAAVLLLPIDEALATPPLAAPIPVSPDALAYVIYTSGSTGEPKGVEMTHRAAMNTVDDICGRYDVRASDRVLAVSSMDFDLSVFDVFGLLCHGGAVVLLAEDDRREARTWVQLVQRYRVTVWNSVPALLDMALVAAGDGADLATLRLALVSGDWVPLDLPGRMAAVGSGCRLVALGGATEAAIWSNAFEADAVDPAWRSVPYGFPLRNQTFRVVDEDGADRPDWVVGELWIGGAGVARGYRNNHQRTAERFVTDHGLRWYRTGDLGRYWPDGTLEFIGRVDNQVKVGGVRIELGEVEAALEAHPLVASAVAVATQDDRRRLLGAVVARADAGRTPDPVQLRTTVAERLPAAMVPERIAVLSGWPLTGNGKVDRAAVLRLLTESGIVPGVGREAAPDSDQAAPLARLEAEIAGLWAQVLRVTSVGRHQNFFDLGGDSLLATHLLERLRRRFGVELTLRTLFAEPTVARNAQCVHRLVAGHAGQQMDEGVL